MIVQDNWEAAEKAVERYQAVILSMRGAFETIVGVASFTQRSRLQLREALYDIARTYLESEVAHIEAETLRAARQSVADAHESMGSTLDAPEVPEAISDYLRASGEHLKTEIAVQLERDIVTVETRLRELALKTRLLHTTRDIKLSAAAIMVRIQEPQDLRFFFRDRAGRRIPSSKHLRQSWRHHLLTVYNEVHLNELAEMGEEKAMIIHPDRKHRWHGELIAIHGVANLKSYHDIADEVFHPNSEATVGRFTISRD